MIQCKCEQCGLEFPMNETLRVAGRVLCDVCCEQVLEARETPETDLERQLDPTICVNCQKDHGATELSRLAGAPVCETCEAFFRNRPYPAWTKLALAAVVALVVVSLVFNMRFFRAYGALRLANASWMQGDLETASSQMASAAGFAPECADIGAVAQFLEGQALLAQDRCVEALAKFRQCKDKLPPDFDVELFILHAEASAAFDAQDYHAFVVAAQRLAHEAPDYHGSRAMVASAFACKYAETGEEAFREEALRHLDKARALANGDPAFTEYEQRILHRIDTREIIKAEEFHRRFPDGWTPEKEG